MAKTLGTPDACSGCHQDMEADHLLTQFDAWFGESKRVADLRDRAHLLHSSWEEELTSPGGIMHA